LHIVSYQKDGLSPAIETLPDRIKILKKKIPEKNKTTDLFTHPSN